MTKDQLGLYQTQIQTNVSFTSFMTAVDVFFSGLLITSIDKYDLSIHVPIALMIISLFGFLYSTLIYTNTAQEVSNENEESFLRAIFLGDVLSEYLGVYLLVLSVPLVVSAVSQDIFLRVVALSAAVVGLAIYQFSNVSMVGRHFPRGRRLISTAFLIFGVGLFLGQFYRFYFYPIASLFILFSVAVIYRTTKKGLSPVAASGRN